MDTSAATGIMPGISTHPVNVMACDVNLDHGVVDRLVKELAASRAAAAGPDFLLLQRVDQTDVGRLSAAMGIEADKSSDRSVFDISVNAEPTDGSWGNAILSAGPMYEGRAIPNEGGGGIGVWAVSVMDGRRFRIASVDLIEGTGDQAGRSQDLEVEHFREAWQAAGDEPMILAMRYAGKSPIEDARKSGGSSVMDERVEVSMPWKLGGNVKTLDGAGSCFGVEVGP